MSSTMISKLAFFSNLLLTSAVLAAPSSRVESPADADPNVLYTTNWAGAVLSEPGGTFTSVTGTFVVPTPSGSDGGAAVWVGIDGSTCRNAILQTGVNIIISGGIVSYSAWYEWLPAPANTFTTDIDINAGDTIVITVVAYSATYGIAVIDNKSNGQMTGQYVNSTYALCGEDAEWIVEDYGVDDNLVPFVNFDSVAFTNASATAFDGTTYTPSDATIFGVSQNGNVMTNTTTSGDTVTINYM